MTDSDVTWEVKPVEWYRFSPELEQKGLCIFCNTVATYMRRKTGGQWQALCEKHKDSTEQP